ncbi:hypothetical protein AOLI_G00001080 [Acnodon oligacanthus]
MKVDESGIPGELGVKPVSEWCFGGVKPVCEWCFGGGDVTCQPHTASTPSLSLLLADSTMPLEERPEPPAKNADREQRDMANRTSRGEQPVAGPSNTPRSGRAFLQLLSGPSITVWNSTS